jgi:hypothetical protein
MGSISFEMATRGRVDPGWPKGGEMPVSIIAENVVVDRKQAPAQTYQHGRLAKHINYISEIACFRLTDF